MNKWTDLILRCSFLSRRLCKESALCAKQDEQNVKVRNRGAIGALWRRMEAEAWSTVQIAEDENEDGGEARIGRSTLRSNEGWRRCRGASCRSSLKPWHAFLNTWLHSYTHAHDLEGIAYHFPGIGQYLNTSSSWNPVTHEMNQLHFRDIFWSIG